MTLGADSDSGNLGRCVDVSGATHFNFLTQRAAWSRRTPGQQNAVEDTLSFRRTAGSAPADRSGSWTTEFGYWAGGDAT